MLITDKTINMEKKIFIGYLLTGKSGMRKAVWGKFKNIESFGATFKEAFREMDGWEAAILELEANDGVEGHELLRKTIGKRMIEKYEIQTI